MMKRVSVLLIVVIIASLTLSVGRVFAASDGHKVLLFGDSLTATNMSNWTYEIKHEYKLVAKGGQDTRWVLSQIRQLVQSGKINNFDTAVVWIGINNPKLAVTDIPQIYAILHSYGIKIIGVTQYLPTHGSPSVETINDILTFDNIIREQADLVVDFAVDPRFVDENGYVRSEISLEGIHLDPDLMAKPIASAIDGAIDELYAPTPSATATATSTCTPTVTKTMISFTATATPDVKNTPAISVSKSGIPTGSEKTYPHAISAIIVVGVIWLMLGLCLKTKQGR